MRRIIYAWDYLNWGGSQIHFLALIKEARKDFDVVVVLPDGSSPQFLGFLTQLGVRYEFFRGREHSIAAGNLREKIRRHFRKFKSEFAMLRRIHALSPDLVHVDLGPHQSLSTLIVLSLRTPLFITSHNRLPRVGALRTAVWKFKFQTISSFKNFHVFCSNEDARTYFKRYYSQRVADEIDVTYTSIDPNEIERVLDSDFDREGLLRSLGISTNRPIVLAVGQFIDRKGRWVFLEAARKVNERLDALFLWLTPSAPEEDTLEQVKSFGLGDSFQVVISDSLGGRRFDVLNFIRSADVFALPSFVEGLPIALLEAMALGVPSISTNVNGIPEAIRDEETGLLVEPADASALADGISRLLSDSDFASTMGKSGRDLVLRQFDERNAARLAAKRYKEVLSRR